MRNSKSFFSFMKKNIKKVTAVFLLAMGLCLYGVTTGAMSYKTASSDDIPLHDGDVLVDSLNVTEETDDADGSTDGASGDETSLVTSDDVSELDNTDTYFQELRASLDLDRNDIIALLTEAESSASTTEKKEEASAEKQALLNYMEQEKTIETLISNKGLPECFVVITDSGVTVTVNTEELDQSTVNKICEIVMRQTDRSASEIVVQGV